MLALASRVEGLTGPDREMDAVVHNKIGAPLPDAFCGVPVVLDYGELECTFTMPIGSGEHAMRVRYECPAYTASRDAAISLVPEGWTYINLEVCARGTPNQRCRVSVERLLDDGTDERVHGYAATPALALAAAALRALAAQGEGNDG